MVAVRSQGLSLESIIGHSISDPETSDVKGVCTIPEKNLLDLMGLANERFVENTKRIARFRGLLVSAFDEGNVEAGKKKGENGQDWEDKDARRGRKRAEGLKRAEEARKAKEAKQAEEESQSADIATDDV
jgi:tRNA wybutosine-synthesizing protein 3